MVTTVLTASTEAQLNADIAEADQASAGSAFIIEFAADISLTTDITEFYGSGVTLTIDGEGYALEDAGGYSGFTNNDALSSLTFENLIIANTGVLPPPLTSGLSGNEIIGATQTINQTTDILIGGSNGAGTITNEGTYNIDQTTSGATGGADDETYGPAIYDAGITGIPLSMRGRWRRLATVALTRFSSTSQTLAQSPSRTPLVI